MFYNDIKYFRACIMKSILKTTLGGKVVEVLLLTPEKVFTQFDFIRVEVDGVEFDISNGFLHGTVLRNMGLPCKQTCIGLSKDLILSVKDSKLILHLFNLHLLEQFDKKKIPFIKQSPNSWLRGVDEECIEVHSTAVQALYYYFKRSASVNESNHVLCNPDARLRKEEAIFLGQFLSYSPYLIAKADSSMTVDGGAVLLDVEDVYHSLKLAVIEINNRRYGNPSVMDAKHPTLSPLFKDNGPIIIDMKNEDTPL